MEITNVSEYKSIVKQQLPKMMFDYYVACVEDQWIMEENKNVFFQNFVRYFFLYAFTVVSYKTIMINYDILIFHVSVFLQYKLMLIC